MQKKIKRQIELSIMHSCIIREFMNHAKISSIRFLLPPSANRGKLCSAICKICIGLLVRRRVWHLVGNDVSCLWVKVECFTELCVPIYFVKCWFVSRADFANILGLHADYINSFVCPKDIIQNMIYHLSLCFFSCNIAVSTYRLKLCLGNRSKYKSSRVGSK